MAKMTGY